jgi:hypothetical protein
LWISLRGAVQRCNFSEKYFAMVEKSCISFLDQHAALFRFEFMIFNKTDNQSKGFVEWRVKREKGAVRAAVRPAAGIRAACARWTARWTFWTSSPVVAG